MKIIPGKMKPASVSSPKAKALKVKWKKLAKAGGYQIQYSQDKTFKKKAKTAKAGAGLAAAKTSEKIVKKWCNTHRISG